MGSPQNWIILANMKFCGQFVSVHSSFQSDLSLEDLVNLGFMNELG